MLYLFHLGHKISPINEFLRSISAGLNWNQDEFTLDSSVIVTAPTMSPPTTIN
jgi:hypothetical protein